MLESSFGWNVIGNNLDAYAFFVALLVATRVLGMTPLGRPLQWAEVFYHELSHGIACLLTLGRVRSIKLKFNGSGVCMTSGGMRLVILLSGYAGAAVWGGLLYLVGARVGTELASYWLMGELAIIGLVIVFWVRDIQTLLILLMMGGLYAVALWWPGAQIVRDIMPWVLQFLGLFVLTNAILAPLELFDGRHVGDGAQLQDMTYVIPEFVWVLLWVAFALLVLAFCAAQVLPGLALVTGLPRVL